MSKAHCREMHRNIDGNLRWCLGCDERIVGLVTRAGDDWLHWAKPGDAPAKIGTSSTEELAMRKVETALLSTQPTPPAGKGE